MNECKNIIVISDLHCGCQLGLCTQPVLRDGGGYYQPSNLQKKVARIWDEFWNVKVPKWTKNENYIIVINGDTMDGVHHQSKTQITHNLSVQSNIAENIIRPQIDNKKCIGYYQLRGTEAHVGQSGEEEEKLAKKLNAISDENGCYSRWEMWMRMSNGALIHFSHHIGTTSSSAYESTGVYKEMVEAFNEAGRWHDEPPDVVVRSHRHRQFETRIATSKGYGISLVTPGWQLKTPFTYRLASGRASTPQIGGYLIRAGDEDEVYTRFKVWKLGRTKEVQL